MKFKKNPGIFLKGLILLAILGFLGGFGSWYVANNPQSLLSYLLHALSIEVFEPTYLEKRKGGDLVFSLKSYSSRSEFDSTTTDFGNCKDQGERTPLTRSPNADTTYR